MRLIGPDSVDSDEVEQYTVRSSVEAVRCDDGATIVDKDGTALAGYDGPCYIIVDGDERQIVTSYVFDAVFAPGSGDSSPAAVNPVEPASSSTTTGSTSSFDETDTSAADPAAASTQEPNVPGSVYADNPATAQTTPPTQAPPPADGEGDSATQPSDAGSSDTPTASQDATAQSSGQ